MSTIAPDKAAQLLFLLLIVILIVNATPVRSLLISFVTSDEGLLVGKGPSVSVGEVVQLPLVVPVEVPVDVPVEVPVLVPESEVASLSFLQPASGAIALMPNAAIKPFLKKSFLSIVLCVGNCLCDY